MGRLSARRIVGGGVALLASTLLALPACATPAAHAIDGAAADQAVSAERVLRVIATAYNSTHAQTDAHPNLGGWGDRIEPGMKVLAVSPDLVAAGLSRGTRVRIDGVKGEWIVLDRTPSRLRNHIDLYMGEDVAAARRWGRRRVTIRWFATEDSP